MTIKPRTSSPVSTGLAAARSQAKAGAESSTRARPDEKRATSKRLPAQAQGALRDLSRFDEGKARGVGKLEGEARPGKSGAAATPFDDFGPGARSKAAGSPLDRLKDGFSNRSSTSFSELYGAAAANGGFSPAADPLANLGPAPTIDPLAGIGSDEKKPGYAPGTDLSGRGTQLSADGTDTLRAAASGGAGLARVIAAVDTAAATEVSLIAAGASTGAGGAVSVGTAAAALGTGTVVAAAGGAFLAGMAVGEAIVAVVPAAGTWFGDRAFELLNSDDDKDSASDFTFDRADAKAELDAQGMGEGVKGSERRSHNLGRPTEGGSGGSGDDSGGDAPAGGGAPVNGLGGDGAENNPILTASAADVPRPKNSWDPVDGVTAHQVGVPTILGQRGGGKGGPSTPR